MLSAAILAAVILGSLAWANGVHLSATWAMTLDGYATTAGGRYPTLQASDITITFTKPMNRPDVQSRVLHALSLSWEGVADPPAQLAEFDWAAGRSVVTVSANLGPHETYIGFEGARDLFSLAVQTDAQVQLARVDPSFVFRSYIGSPDRSAGGFVSSGIDLWEEVMDGPMALPLDSCHAWPSPDGRHVVFMKPTGDSDGIDHSGLHGARLWVYTVGSGRPREVGRWPHPICSAVWRSDSSGFFVGPSYFTADGGLVIRWAGYALAASVFSDETRVAVLVPAVAHGQDARLDLVIWDRSSGSEIILRGLIEPTLHDGAVQKPSFFAWHESGTAVTYWDPGATTETVVDLQSRSASKRSLTRPPSPLGATVVLSPDGTKAATLTRLKGGWSCLVSEASSGAELTEYFVKTGSLIWSPDSTKMLFPDEAEVYDLNGRRVWVGRRGYATPPIQQMIGWDPDSESVLFIAQPMPSPYPPGDVGDLHWREYSQIRVTPELLGWIEEVRTVEGAHIRPVDDDYRLVLISRGPMPSTGYEVEIEKWGTSPQLWTVFVAYTDPAPDQAQADVITYPVTYMAFRNDGRDIEVQRHDGTRWISVPLYYHDR